MVQQKQKKADTYMSALSLHSAGQYEEAAEKYRAAIAVRDVLIPCLLYEVPMHYLLNLSSNDPVHDFAVCVRKCGMCLIR